MLGSSLGWSIAKWGDTSRRSIWRTNLVSHVYSHLDPTCLRDTYMISFVSSGVWDTHPCCISLITEKSDVEVINPIDYMVIKPCSRCVDWQMVVKPLKREMNVQNKRMTRLLLDTLIAGGRGEWGITRIWRLGIVWSMRMRYRSTRQSRNTG